MYKISYDKIVWSVYNNDNVILVKVTIERSQKLYLNI